MDKRFSYFDLLKFPDQIKTIREIFKSKKKDQNNTWGNARYRNFS